MEGRRALARLIVTGTVALACAACSIGAAGRQILEAQEADAEGLHLDLMVASCNGDPTAEVDEHDDRVMVRVTGGTTNDDCADGICIVLDRPLGGRVLIDATTDAAVPVAGGDGTLVGCPLSE
ncbi:MAG: hypothetical protein ACK4V6_01530 [Microthrixaceae bacterium]